MGLYLEHSIIPGPYGPYKNTHGFARSLAVPTKTHTFAMVARRPLQTTIERTQYVQRRTNVIIGECKEEFIDGVAARQGHGVSWRSVGGSLYVSHPRWTVRAPCLVCASPCRRFYRERSQASGQASTSEWKRRAPSSLRWMQRCRESFVY